MPGDATRARTVDRARWCGPARLVVLYAVLVSSAVACGDHDEGRTLRAPTAEQTTTTTVAAPASADPGAGAAAGSGGAAGTTPPTGEPLRRAAK